MSSVLYRLGRFSASRPWTVIGLWVVLAVTVIASSVAFGRQLEDTFDLPGVDSQIAVDLLSEANADRAGVTARVVASPTGGATFTEAPDAARALGDLHAELQRLPNVVAVNDPTGPGAMSPDGRVALMTVQYPVIDDLDPVDLERLKDVLADAPADGPLQIEAGGDLYWNFEEPGTGTGELIGILAAVVILLVAFGSLIAMGLPILTALFGLALGVTAMSLLTYVIEIPSWAPQIGSMIGLGVGIDYALFLVTRHREFLTRGMTVAEAAGRAVATAGQAVVFAGGTVVIAILGLAVAGVPAITAAGIAISVIVLIMVIGSITLVPALLGLSGHAINRFGIHRRGHAVGGVSAGWRRWGTHVSRHAWSYAIGVTVVLGALTAPVLALQLGFPDEGTLPDSRTERAAYDLVADGFGPGVNGPLVIAVDLSGATADGVEATVDGLAAAIVEDAGIVAVAPPEIAATADVATIVAFPTTAPQDDATFDTVDRLRSDVFPEALAGSGATAHVGGQTANFGDIADRVSGRLPWFVAAVVVLSFLLLTVVFRSVLVPLKAAILNLLSIGAAYGVLVMVFQWGWGKGLIGLESTVPIVSFIPLFMFAVLFGLSMDYEVFLLSRVREEYLETGDNDRSVIAGLAGTARVITSAALIMISVFAGFVLGDDPVVKMMGLGLATAIFVDATIVRVVLVPATMKLMGDANWWLPAWLDRILPAVDIEGETGLPTPEMEPVVAAESVDESGPDDDRDREPALV